MRAFPIFFSLFFPWSSRYFSGLSSPLIVLVVLQCDFVFPHAIIIPRSRPYFPGGCQSTFLFRHLNWIEALALNFFFFGTFHCHAIYMLMFLLSSLPPPFFCILLLLIQQLFYYPLLHCIITIKKKEPPLFHRSFT